MTSKKPSLADLRAKFKAKAEGKTGNFTGNSDVYPHWNIAENATAIIRILPDKNEDNENYFFIDKLEHKLSINGKDRKIPCVKMYGEKCPICELSSKYYKAEGKDSVQGKYYYFKRTSLLKALIIKDPIDYSGGGESAEGQVKTVQFTYQLMKLINAALANEEEELALEELPWDMEAGYNFLITKTKQGQYDNYSTSSFSNRVSAIADKYLDAVEEGRIDLSTLLPENPGLEKVQALLEAHLGGGDEEEEVDETPVIQKRKQPVAESSDDDMPTRRKPVAEEVEDEEETPIIKKRKPVVEEEEEEEAPVRKRKVVVEEEEEEEVPVRKRKVVVEEEEEAPVVKKRKPVVEEDDEDEGDEDSEIVARIKARKQKASE